MHGIILLTDVGGTVGFNGTADGAVRAGLKPAPTGPTLGQPNPLDHLEKERYSLSEIVRAFKTFSARRINELRDTKGGPVWQRNYYEHVIRDEIELNLVRQYILDNPSKWESDRDNPEFK